MSPLLVFLILLNAYILLVFILVKTGWMQRLGMSLFGPALMIKTQRGRGLLDWFAKARAFFVGLATVGTWLAALMMVFMSAILLLQLLLIFQLSPEQAPSPRYALGIPGINPIIPVGFGIIALIFAVVVHEFAHGILARAYGLKVKTMGLLFFIVPIGAFVEPDEDELKRAPRKHRVHTFAAGVIVNMVFAVLFGLVFSSALMGQASPVEGGPVQTVIGESPADQAGLRPGMIIISLDGQPVRDPAQFSQHVNKTAPGDTVHLTMRDGQSFDVQTLRCSELYAPEVCARTASHPDPQNRSVMGVSIYDTGAVQDRLARPFGSPRALLEYVVVPFQALQGNFPLGGVYTQFYDVPFDPATFWFLANLMYWLFWINLMLGMTNALPIVPLDGGHMFRDFVGSFYDRFAPGKSQERREQLVRRTSAVVAILLLVAVLLQFVGPYLGALF